MLEKLQSQDFDKVYAIMEEAFPFDERRTYDEQKELLSNPNYCVYVLYDNRKDIKSFVTIYQFDEFAFIEHFATSNKYRKQGFGSLILNELFNLLNCRFCLEVELPETEFAKRRIEFYKRNGFFVNNFDYIQPPISEGKKALRLILMTSGGTLTKNEFEKTKAILYKKVYRINKKKINFNNSSVQA
mgnify:FL=1